ncbi:MAG: sulfatase-like hydrolase/transferase [Anaerolineales bacterium]|nr:sulfatase-like hydrolase/transferase [Anaerolineales bacterium]
MSSTYTRRDFLKLAGLLSLSAVTPSFTSGLQATRQTQVGKKNVLIIVFDAFSAHHLSLHGYGRETTPNLARLAERAVVYHNHYAGGCFTTPGTASLLTGAHPWKHRALKYYVSVSEDFVNKTIFSVFDDYYRIAYSHNPLVTTVLDKFASSIDKYIPLEQFFLTSEGILHSLFRNDNDVATISWSRAMKKEDEYSYSLFLSHLYELYQKNKVKQYTPLFPIGMPAVLVDNYFLLEDAMDAIGSLLRDASRPFLGYFHFMPPHQPYSPPVDFFNTFTNDNLPWINKPEDMFTHNKDAQFLRRRCQQYDEYILYVDREFGKFMDHLESFGLLDDTWVVLTSDHGELFERGILGHTSEVLYQPVIRVPLMIFEPGRKTRIDIHTKTSAVDVLPTLAHVTGGTVPDWTEGLVLPPYSNDAPDPNRNLYIMQAKQTEPGAPITEGTLTLIKGQYKIMYFFGYEKLNGIERVELYDIEADPEELIDLSISELKITAELLGELKAKLAEVNKPYL